MTGNPAGWQPSPDRPGQLRYWDGEQWTEHYAPVSPPPPPAASAPAASASKPAASGAPIRLIAEVVGAVVVLLIGVGIGIAAAGSDNNSPSVADSKAAAAASSSTTPSESATPSARETPLPTFDAATQLTADAFVIEVKVTSKQCFGSAGCNVEYKVVPTYSGNLSDLDGVTFDLTYSVRGDESGSQVGTLSFDDGQYDVSTNSASTSSNGVKLTATPTSVDVY